MLLEAGSEFMRHSRIGGVVSLGLHYLPGQSVATARIGAVYHASAR
ncbi:MAG: hypothetical protein ACHQNV_09805 [Vicinamibacteria bacterium]